MLWEGAVVTAQPGKHWDPSCELRSLRNIGVLLGLDGLAGLLTLGYSPQEMNREPRVLGCVHIQNNYAIRVPSALSVFLGAVGAKEMGESTATQCWLCTGSCPHFLFPESGHEITLGL